MSKNKLPAQDVSGLWRDTPVSGFEPEKLIGIARTQLLIKFPFFGRLAMRLIPTPTQMIPTAAVDPKGRMYYNPKFLNACTIEDAIFVIAHEVMHLVQRCASRFPDGGLHSLWNIASDIVVNITLDQAKISPRSEWRTKFMGFEGEFRKFESKLITDYIYYELIKKAKDNTDCEACKQVARGILEQNKQRSEKQRQQREQEQGNQDGDNQDGGNQASDSGEGHNHGDGEECNHGGDSDSSGDSDSAGGNDGSGQGNGQPLKHTCGNPQGCCSGVTGDKSQAGDADDAEAMNQWQRHVLGAAENLTRGNLPGVVQDILERLVKPSITWKDIVRATGTPIYGKDRYSWKRNSRRGLAMNIHLPVAMPEKKGGLVFIDTSGSISDEQIVQFCSEVTGILDAIGCQKIYIGLHDYQVYDLVEVGKSDLQSKLKFARGGTSHIDVFNLANGQDSARGFKLPRGFEVGMIICFTDLCTDFPNEPPKWPVIWGVPSEYKEQKAPWGKKVEVVLQMPNKRG